MYELSHFIHVLERSVKKHFLPPFNSSNYLWFVMEIYQQKKVI